MNDRISAFIIAVIITTGLLLLFYLLYEKTYSTTEQLRFMVVDTYEGCDVVRYANTSDARYHYFLHCKQQ
jgi:hypothetical protein